MSDGKRVFRPKSAPDGTTPVPGASPIASVGDILRARREELGWKLPDVAAWLRIRLPYLEALEAGRASELPGSAYAIGFLRTYAKALGLDGEPLAARFKVESRGAFTRRAELSFPVPLPDRGLPTGVLLLCGIVILVGAYVGWYKFSSSESTGNDLPARLTLPGTSTIPASPQVASMLPPTDDRPTPQPLPPQEREALTGMPATPASSPPADVPIPAPMPASPTQPLEKMGEDRNVLAQQQATTQPATGAANTVTLNATATTWVQVRKSGGAILYNGVLHPGETWQAPADQTDLIMTVGNAGGLTLSSGGVTTQPLGRNGEVRHNVPLSPASIADGSVMHAGTAAAPAATPPGGNNLSPPLPQHFNAE
ncbi:helix-turn-helix domain-containing protein [Komagataeibacter medellinensis]|uniref:Helix-turn-helix domain-containing protein n=1 Tax=Komagataeibacter medellinensis TaxID=1177712 RepID=A0ABQ6VQV1_9PROT|nr:helix-turn-helix domain-containing protein [Komagataeibacter medellinensis]KAB8122264.1 helix-turn-helix domain-containing protein [Komagataeibacter medellinensis]